MPALGPLAHRRVARPPGAAAVGGVKHPRGRAAAGGEPGVAPARRSTRHCPLAANANSPVSAAGIPASAAPRQRPAAVRSWPGSGTCRRPGRTAPGRAGGRRTPCSRRTRPARCCGTSRSSVAPPSVGPVDPGVLAVADRSATALSRVERLDVAELQCPRCPAGRPAASSRRRRRCAARCRALPLAHATCRLTADSPRSCASVPVGVSRQVSWPVVSAARRPAPPPVWPGPAGRS